MLSQSLKAITGFSTKPLRYITYTGMIIFLFSFALAAYLVFLKFFFEPPAGWTLLAVLILFATGMQMISMGIIAEYLSKLFQQNQGRPNYVIDTIYSSEQTD